MTMNSARRLAALGLAAVLVLAGWYVWGPDYLRGIQESMRVVP